MIIWKCEIKSPKRPKVSSKYCDYFNKVSGFKYLNICLWFSEYLSLNICLSLFTKTLDVFWSILTVFDRLLYILIRWPRIFFSGRSLVMISFKFPASGSLPVIFISLNSTKTNKINMSDQVRILFVDHRELFATIIA